MTADALKHVRVIKKPSGACAQTLRAMFPVTKQTPNKRPFDPLQECVALAAQKKKSSTGSTRMKTVTIQAVMLSKGAPLVVPKGKKRLALADGKRITTLSLKRGASPFEVRNSIVRAFSLVCGFEYLDATGGVLTISKDQNPDGGILDRRGALYLREADKVHADVSESPRSGVDGQTSRNNSQPNAFSLREALQVRTDCSEADGSGMDQLIARNSQSNTLPRDVQDTEQEERQNIRSNCLGAQLTDSIPRCGSDVDDLPPIRWRVQEPVEERQAIIAAQDEAYQQSLQADRRKQLVATKQRERAEKVRLLRNTLAEKMVRQSDGLRIVFRLPKGERIEGVFQQNCSVKCLYEHVFVDGQVDEPFGVYTSCPRRLLSFEDTFSVAISEVLTVEEGENLVDLVELSDEIGVPNCQTDMEVLQQADCARKEFMESLSLRNGAPFTVDRQRVFDEVLVLYRTHEQDVLQIYPFRVKFSSERAIDAGGVAHDLFSAFFEEAYTQLFDGSSLLCPVVHPGMIVDTLKTVGLAISHAYLVTGLLPTRVSFPCLAQCLLDPQTDIPDAVLFDCFVDSISSHEGEVVKQALNEIASGVEAFSKSLKLNVLSILSRFNIRDLPTPKNFKKMLINVARYEFISKPVAAVSLLNMGVPAQHKPFWNSISVHRLMQIYRAQSISTEMTLRMFEDAEGENESQCRILFYLRQYIGNMSSDELLTFLRFVTGAATCSSMKVSVLFNSTSGLSRRPIAHTCSPSLELSTTYRTYKEFIDEFKTCLHSLYAWTMDAI